MVFPSTTMTRSMPPGRARNGVPTGFQIAGRSYCDGDVFQVAMAYETARGQWFRDAVSRPKL